MRPYLSIIALAAAVLPGCVIYDHQATATFDWNVSSCARLGIDHVSVDLTPQSGNVDLVADAPCEDGALTFDGLDPDTYIVSVDALANPQVPVVHVDDQVSVFPGDNVFSYRF